MTNEELIKIGFKEIPHFTIGNSVLYDLGRKRHLSASNIGTPNEVVFLCQVDDKNPKEITDLVCVHNWDYDGRLTTPKILTMIKVLEGGKK